MIDEKQAKAEKNQIYTKVPQERSKRDLYEAAVSTYVLHNELVPPLTENEILQHAYCLQKILNANANEIIYISLLLHNHIWLKTIRSIPFERRLLLLPQCLSNPDVCKAEKDIIGLLCVQCGGCVIGTIQAEADKLGYITLVAEGTTVVSKLLSSGKVDSVIGVGCLDSLQKIFPVMSKHAIPGQGIPLLCDGCRNTELDLQWTLKIIQDYAPAPSRTIINLERVAEYVREWFKPQNITDVMGSPVTETQKIAQDWLATDGKRWRPILTTSIFSTAGGSSDKIRKAAIAVECFHKASLIHDDIEDDDDKRYGRPTVHVNYGIPAAINAGDYLIGEGYRLLATSDFKAEACIKMIKAAAEGHRELCLGQGEELAFYRKPQPVTEKEVLRIYRQKTSAAFKVAVLVGATAANLNRETCETLSEFSTAIGTAYQIQDDIEDFRSEPGRAADMLALRPTLFLALACMSELPEIQKALSPVWNKESTHERIELIKAIENAGLHQRVELLYSHYRHKTERILANIHDVELKRLLRNIMTRMLKS
ncbi:MAG: polyprenyl synthetase family protein [Kiritimatiellae bacterium]|jgi:geranylgeranyl diphosphate synthase type II|nr:polyprenyl synthetase family protein [Kiritimatiellia bacterium]